MAGEDACDIKTIFQKSADKKLDYLINKINKYDELFTKISKLSSKVDTINGNLSGLAEELNIIDKVVEKQQHQIENDHNILHELINKSSNNSTELEKTRTHINKLNKKVSKQLDSMLPFQTISDIALSEHPQ